MKLMLASMAALVLLTAHPVLSEIQQPATLAGGPVTTAVVITHGGVGSPPDWSDDCNAAASAGLAGLEGILGGALNAACAAVVHLEDICRFNAGTGAHVRLDGKTVQMDAAVMTSDGQFAAVAAVERVRNPVLVAREVLRTPHRLLVGEGATRFAHRLGFDDESPICAEAVMAYRRRFSQLLRGTAGGGYDTFDWRAAWNYPSEPPSEVRKVEAVPLFERPLQPSDTVGSVVRAADGTFAVALSTGGTGFTLLGRVGDVPIYACGAYAGPAGAVACTGFGEEIIRHAMARLVYEHLATGKTAREAVLEGCAVFGNEWSLGIIAVGQNDWAVAANREMAWGYAKP